MRKTLLVLAALAVTANSAASQDIGKREFTSNCAVCHGSGGKGNGPLASMLTTLVPDLTTLQARNSGVFPFKEIYSTIDGTMQTPAHGTIEMPAWGTEYSFLAPYYLGPYYTKSDAEAFVRGRMLALIAYVYELQQK